MEVFYCNECKEWFSFDEGAYYPIVEKATRFEPEQFSDIDCCCKCGTAVDMDLVIDDVVEFLNKKKVTI